VASAQPFATALRQHRLAAGHSQESLAERAGLSRRGISDLERGLKRAPHLYTVERLADALALDPPQRAAFLAAARGQRPAPSSVPRLPALPLVGRHAELALFDACLSGAAPLALFLAGVPGIGKSRLLAEAARLAREQGWEVLAGGCMRQQGQEPYEPLTSALARHLSQMAPARQRMVLEGCAWLVRLLPELAERHVVPAPTWELPPPQERRLMFAAVARYAANVAGPQGTLLLLDDLQWAGADAVDLLASLIRNADERPLRVLGAYRSTEVHGSHPLAVALADLARDGLAAEAGLGPLAADEATTLLDGLWKNGAEGSDDLRQRVLRRAGGVPFFLVSCAQAVRLSSSPKAALHGAALGGSGGETIPWDVAQTVRQRVAALPESARELLAVAAVAGRVMPAGVLLAVAGTLGQSRWQALGAAEACVRAGLLLEHDRARYSFVHDLIHEVVVADLSAGRTAALHQELAAALEALPGEPPVEQLADHYARAGNTERAVVYLERAGDHARAIYAHDEARAHYQELARCLDELGRALDAARVREQLGYVLILLGRYEDALRALEQAAEAYRSFGDVEGAASTLGWIAHAHARAGSSGSWLEEAEPLREAERLAASGRASRGVAWLYANLATAFHTADRYADELDTSLRAIELARTLEDETILVNAMLNEGMALLGLGRRVEARSVLEETAALADRIEDLRALPRACYELKVNGTTRCSKRQAKAMKCSPASTAGSRS
jgi:transcriptional regulator with XRE-family HTH domain/tetratricopeptide (TPR) repeat protein